MTDHALVTAHIDIVAEAKVATGLAPSDREAVLERLRAIGREAERDQTKLGHHLAGMAQGTLGLLEEMWSGEEMWFRSPGSGAATEATSRLTH